MTAWYFARDCFLGIGGLETDVQLGLRLAAKCSHPDAAWLTSCFGTPESLRDVRGSLARGGTDGRTACFAGLFGRETDLMVEAASKGQVVVAYALKDCDALLAKGVAQEEPLCLLRHAQSSGDM